MAKEKIRENFVKMEYGLRNAYPNVTREVGMQKGCFQTYSQVKVL